MSRLTVTLTDELTAAMRKVVDDGEYVSESEIVRDALQSWAIRREQRRLAMEEIGRLWDVGLASGPASDGETAFARITAQLEADIGSLHGQ